MFADFAEPAAVLDPVVTVVMCLLAPQAMANDRIAPTQGTPAKDTLPASRPVKAGLAMVQRKWDNGVRTAWKALTEQNLDKETCPEQSLPPPCSTSAHEG